MSRVCNVSHRQKNCLKQNAHLQSNCMKFMRNLRYKRIATSEITTPELEQSLEKSLSDLVGVEQRYEDCLKDLESECCTKDATLHKVCFELELNSLDEQLTSPWSLIS